MKNSRIFCFVLMACCVCLAEEDVSTASYVEHEFREDQWAFHDLWWLRHGPEAWQEAKLVGQVECLKLSDGTIRIDMISVDDGYEDYCPFISGCKVIIPSSYHGWSVSEIRDFDCHCLIDELEISSDVNARLLFDKNAFRKIRFRGKILKEYQCPNKTWLEEVDLPDVEVIGDFAFSDCIRLSRVKTSSSLKSIGIGAFWSCPLSAFPMHMGLKNVGAGAFCDTKITSLYFPASVTNIGLIADAGWSMSNLKSLEVDSSNPCYSSKDNILYSKHKTDLLFARAHRLPSISIPSVVTNIGTMAFASMPWLNSVVIPPGTRIIGDKAFWGCTRLSQIILPELDWIGANIFERCEKLKKIAFLKAPPRRHPTGNYDTLQGHYCSAVGMYQQAWIKEWENVIVDGKYFGLPMEGIVAKVHELPDDVECHPLLAEWTDEKLTGQGIPKGSKIDLGLETTTDSLNAARLLGIDPKITTNDDAVQISSDVDFRIVSFVREDDAFVIQLQVLVNEGVLPDEYRLGGSVLIAASNALDGEWSYFQPVATTLTRDSATQATISLRFDLSDCCFFIVRIVDAEDVIILNSGGL